MDRQSRAPALTLAAALAVGLAAVGCGDPLVVLGDAPGLMRIVAGVPTSSGTAVDSLATRTHLTSPRGVAIGGDGILYVADSRARILAVASNGRASMVLDHSAGCTAAPCVNRPESIALDGRGGLLIADPPGNRVWHLELGTGNLSVVAGTGAFGDSRAGSPARDADLKAPHGVAVATDGTVYFSENAGNRIRSVDGSGILGTVIASPDDVDHSDDALAWFILENPAGLALAGELLYVADSHNHQVVRVHLSTGDVEPVAGSTLPGFSGDGGQARVADLNQPLGVAVSRDGRNLYIADSANHRVRAVHLASGIITTLAGTGTGSYTGDELPGGETALLLPTGLAASPLNHLFIASTGHHVVWRTQLRF